LIKFIFQDEQNVPKLPFPEPNILNKKLSPSPDRPERAMHRFNAEG